MDAELSRTYAGRILLEADLQLKQSVGDIMHPDGELGMLFWDNFYDNAEVMFDTLSDLCFSFRQWVVPGEVSLVESDDTLFVLRALLDVKLESEYATAGRTVLHGGVRIESGCPPGSIRVQVCIAFVSFSTSSPFCSFLCVRPSLSCLITVVCLRCMAGASRASLSAVCAARAHAACEQCTGVRGAAQCLLYAWWLNGTGSRHSSRTAPYRDIIVRLLALLPSLLYDTFYLLCMFVHCSPKPRV